MRKVYKVASEEGGNRYGKELGEDVELDLVADQERALLAAGWLEENTEKKPKEAQ